MTTHVEAKKFSGEIEHVDITARSHPKGRKFVMENNGEVMVYDGHSWAWQKTAIATPAGTIWTNIDKIPQRKGEHLRDTQLNVHHDHVGQGAFFEQQPDTLVENQGGYESIKVTQTEPVKP